MNMKTLAKLFALSGAAMCFGAMPGIADNPHCRQVAAHGTDGVGRVDKIGEDAAAHLAAMWVVREPRHSAETHRGTG